MKTTKDCILAEFVHSWCCNFGGGKGDRCGALFCKLSSLSIKMNVPALSALIVQPFFPNTVAWSAASFAELAKSI